MQSLFLAASEGGLNISVHGHGFSPWVRWGMNHLQIFFFLSSSTSTTKILETSCEQWRQQVSFIHDCFLLSSSACVDHATLLSSRYLSFHSVPFWHFVYYSWALLQAGNDCFNWENCILAATPRQFQESRRRRSRAIMAADIHSFVRQFYWKGHFVNIFQSRWKKWLLRPQVSFRRKKLSVTMLLMKLSWVLFWQHWTLSRLKSLIVPVSH